MGNRQELLRPEPLTCCLGFCYAGMPEGFCYNPKVSVTEFTRTVDGQNPALSIIRHTPSFPYEGVCQQEARIRLL